MAFIKKKHFGMPIKIKGENNPKSSTHPASYKFLAGIFILDF